MTDGLNDIFNDFAKQVYDAKGKGQLINRKLYQDTAEKLTDGLMSGFGKKSFEYDDPNNALAACLKANLNVFSAAKSLTEYGVFSSLLTDEKGDIKPFNQFRQDVESLHKLYNENWLRTEYDTALASGQNTAKWQDFVKSGVEYIRFKTMEDDRVRYAHRLLDNKVGSIDDPSFPVPPLDWECRCTLLPENSAGEHYEQINGKLIKEAKINPLFKNNPATSGVVYGPSHAYFKTANPQKISELDAVKNYGMPKVESLYNLYKFPEKKSILKADNIKKAWTEYRQQYRAVDNGFVLPDYNGRSILVTDDLRDKIIARPEDHDAAGVIGEVITNPDEVFINHLRGKRYKMIYSINYIKYFENNPVVVVAYLRMGNPIVVKSAYEVEPVTGGHISDFRRGVLDKKITRW